MELRCPIHKLFFPSTVYINHRPVFGLTPLQVGKAFRVLGDKLQDERYWSVDRGELLTLLHLKGITYIIMYTPTISNTKRS